MNFIDFIILSVVLTTLGFIAYNNIFKKDKDVCSKCIYKRENCNCGNKEQKRTLITLLLFKTFLSPRICSRAKFAKQISVQSISIIGNSEKFPIIEQNK